ncbi:heterokaryon incompatibility protein domain-containing protein, partial [Trichoderma compactum]
MSVSNGPRKEVCDQTLDKICHDCSQYNFNEALAIRFNDYPSDGIVIANVGKRYRTPFETNCSLCHILLASRKSYLSLYPLNDEDEDGTDELRAFNFWKENLIIDYHWEKGTQFIKKNMSIYIDLVSSKFPANLEQRRNQGAKHGFAIIRQPHEHPDKFTAQVVPPYFDSAVAKGWMEYCKQHHTKICSSQKKTSVICLNLIDCESRILEQRDTQARYVALSYVWGSSTASDQYALKSTSDGKFSLPAALPPVILDAIVATQSLGFRYLWVDKFCIDQFNNEVKQQQILHMDSVYENAEITIIAAAGIDENYGLPGIRSKSRSAQPIARMEGLTIVSTMRDIHDSINSSKWLSRGWTFQEAMLPRRRLIFTDEQTYFECRGINCYESLCGSLAILYGLYTQRAEISARFIKRICWR